MLPPSCHGGPETLLLSLTYLLNLLTYFTYLLLIAYTNARALHSRHAGKGLRIVSTYVLFNTSNIVFLRQAPWDKPDSRPSTGWPSAGTVEFREYSTRYREKLGLAVKDVTFKTQTGEKVR